MRDLAKSKSIHDVAVSCAKEYLSNERKLLEALLAVEEDRTYELHESTYLTPYCMKVLGLSQTIAECFVRIVRKSHHVPELIDSVIKGEVDLYKAKSIASVITPENKEEWLAKAKSMPKQKLERAVALQNGLDKKRMTVDLKFETVDLLKRAQDLLATKQAAFAEQEEVIHAALKEYVSRHDPVEKAKRAEAKDWSRGQSVEHQVNLRDLDQCQWIYPDGSQCTERKWTHRHHIIHRKHGGPDTLENLVTLCAGHHRMIHREH